MLIRPPPGRCNQFPPVQPGFGPSIVMKKFKVYLPIAIVALIVVAAVFRVPKVRTIVTGA